MREAAFYYQVSLPHYKDPDFLEDAFARYREFLYLKTLFPEESLCPAHDMQLMWHTHQAHPLEYAADTMAIYGRILECNNLNASDEDSETPSDPAELTASKWSETYMSPYQKEGAMDRGNAPFQDMAAISDAYLQMLNKGPQIIEFSIKKLTLPKPKRT